MGKLISETRLMWGMPITVAVVKPIASQASDKALSLISQVFAYFGYIDDKFSTYKPTSEISLINQGVLNIEDASSDMQTVLGLAETLRLETDGYFNIAHEGRIDPSGLVKGWALSKAADMLCNSGYDHFYVEAGGDFQAVGLNAESKPWRIGIRNPFHTDQIVKVLAVSNCGVATSGTYIRGQHIYDPIGGGLPDAEILSLTVIGPNVYEADCYATAAFAMGRAGIRFIQSLDGFEGYMIDQDRQATFTTGFDRYRYHENH